MMLKNMGNIYQKVIKLFHIIILSDILLKGMEYRLLIVIIHLLLIMRLVEVMLLV